MADFLEYSEVVQEVRGAMNPGRLKLQQSGVVFKNVKTGLLDQYQASDIEKANWLVRARGFCLKLSLANGNIHRYDGFRDSEFDKLSSFIDQHYDTKLEKVDMSIKGWNWGNAKFEGNALGFEVKDGNAFEVPLGYVCNSIVNKNEVTLEFHQNDDAAVSLVEMRFHVPGDGSSETNPVEEFHQSVMDKADIIQETGKSIGKFEEVQCLTPRGRYDIKIFPAFLQLHGKTFDYKIPYTTILRLFLLPHRDGRQMFFVVSLDPPIKQGQTRYHFLILLFNKEDETTLELGLSEEEIQEKYEGKLTKDMHGPEYEIISRIMKTLVSRKITVPGNFMGNSGTQSISCSYKAATGFLYPLERGFIFVHKPPLHIRFDEVTNVNFSRNSGSTRSFDFEVDTRSGTNYIFSSIEKDEYGKLYDFVTQKKLRVKNIGGKKGADAGYMDDMLDSGDEANVDGYLERMKKEGQRVDMDEDEDESTDESYALPDDIGSDVAEEYDTDAVSSSSSTDESDEGGANNPEDEEAKRLRKEARKAEKLAEKKARTVREPSMKKSSTKRKSKGKKKKNKDPNKPKRPQSGYFLWLNENRERMKEENPGISITDLSKKAGEQWRELTDKTEWDEKAKIEKEKYEVAMKEYLENKVSSAEESEEEDKPSKKAAKKKSSSPKKKPVADTKAGSGHAYKSKEYISSSGSGSESDSDDKPLKKKVKKEKAEKPKKKAAKKEEVEDSEESSAAEDSGDSLKSDEERTVKTRRQKTSADLEKEKDLELPSEEEIFDMNPDASGSDKGSDSGSD